MAERRAPSLRARLLAALLASLVVLWLGAAAVAYFDARDEVDEVLDAHLAQAASLVLAQAARGTVAEAAEVAGVHRRARKVAFQVWERGEVLRQRSANAPATRLSPRDEGFARAAEDGRDWRVFSAWDASRRVLVQVGERADVRREIAGGVVHAMLLPFAVALPLLGLLAWWSVTRSLRPLAALADDARRRGGDDLRPLALDAVPREALPLVTALNGLLARVEALLENERRFTADAAHELRTPLAALRAQAQVAQGSGDDAERTRALQGVIEGCDRASRLVEQLLTLARLSQPASTGDRPTCDLHAVARQVVADLAPAALAKGIEIGFEADGPGRVEADPGLVAIALRNLLDNAVRYGPAGKPVEVRARGVEVTISDHGPGIPPEARHRVGQRFFRVLGTGEAGSGLGLSIVARIAEVQGATLALEPADGGGLRARSALPVPR